jgi:hypothetical protein
MLTGNDLAGRTAWAADVSRGKGFPGNEVADNVTSGRELECLRVKDLPWSRSNPRARYDTFTT